MHMQQSEHKFLPFLLLYMGSLTPGWSHQEYHLALLLSVYSPGGVGVLGTPTDQLLQSGESTENFNVIEWLLNKSQIDRITDIVEIIDKHKSQVDTYYKPINDFLALVKAQESNKTLSIDTVGEMII